MTTITFDTHAFVKRLTAVGMPENQAEVLADEQAKLIENRLATKDDIDRAGLVIKMELAPIRAELLVVKWMLGVILAGVMSLVIKTFL
jgi:hypothetical protein